MAGNLGCSLSLKRADAFDENRRRLHSLDPGAEGKMQPKAMALGDREAGLREECDPLVDRTIADVRRVAQQFERLEPRVEQGISRGNHVHEKAEPARLEHATHFGESRGKVAPMMGAVARRDDVEGRVGVRQGLRPALPRLDVANSPAFRLHRHGREHGGCQVVGHDPMDQRRQSEGNVPTAATDVERMPLPLRRDGPCHEVEVLARGMNAARDIGAGPVFVLSGHIGIMRLDVHCVLRLACDRREMCGCGSTR